MTPGSKWFRSLHYGGTHVCLWWRIAPDGGLYIADELTQERGLIADLCLHIRQQTRKLGIKDISYTIAFEDQMLGKTKASDEGETREQTFRNNGITLRLATHDPVQGWTRISELLGSRPDGRPYLTISPKCQSLIRCLTNAVSDPTDPESILESPNDQPLRALRLGAMSRPSPKPFEKPALKKNAVGHLVDKIRQGESKSRLAWR